MKYVIQDKIQQAIAALKSDHVWSDFNVPEFDIGYPQHTDHGDYASNIAMKLAKLLKKNPLDIGEEIKAHIDMDGLDKVEVVRPGFINFFINEQFLAGGVRYILEQQEQYGVNAIGTNEDGSQETVLVEFLSANPTGPIHLGNGRGGFVGDAIARTMRKSGYEVISEYYMNDYGSQIDTLAESVLRRYLQGQGIKIDYPEDLYQGEYIKKLAEELTLEDAPLGSQDAMNKMRNEVRNWALQQMIADIKTLAKDKLDIHYDVWKSEASLHEGEILQEVWNFLDEHNLTFKKDDATFFATTRYGDDKDRVLVKANGEHTYFLSDIVYLLDKFEKRKVDHWVWVLGADHHGYKGRMEAAIEAIGHKGKMDIIFVQLMRLIFNGQELKMSKRKGTFVTVDEIVDEVSLDVVRWFFLAHEPNTHMDFDLNLAREESDKNPVFYVQYAHARIASIIAKSKEADAASVENVSKIVFTNAAEEQLAKTLFKFPELVEDVAKTYAVHKYTQYASEVARSFHKFYAASRIVEDDGSVNTSRLQLAMATKVVLQQVLDVMGIAAPDNM